MPEYSLELFLLLFFIAPIHNGQELWFGWFLDWGFISWYMYMYCAKWCWRNPTCIHTVTKSSKCIPFEFINNSIVYVVFLFYISGTCTHYIHEVVECDHQVGHKEDHADRVLVNDFQHYIGVTVCIDNLLKAYKDWKYQYYCYQAKLT